MYLKYTNPNEVGVSKEQLDRFLEKVNIPSNKIHNLAMLRGNFIFLEATSKYHKINELHRMYSQTKSYVGLAIGILVDEGKIDINNTLASYFPEYIDKNTDEVLLTQTVAQTLEMTSCVRCENWFTSNETDRVRLYFKQHHVKEPGIEFEYDSAGSQVLSALVEKISGMHLYDFLNLKVFKYLDFFKGSYMLYTPDYRNWGDSGLICDLRANLAMGRLYLNKGVYNGNRIVSENWINLQTSKKIDNYGPYEYKKNGYAYQIWMLKNGYAFLGMGNQLTLIFPNKDIVITMTSSCFPAYNNRDKILEAVYEFIDSVNDYGMVKESKPFKTTLKTFVVEGSSNIDSYLNKNFILEDNSPIKSFKITKCFSNYKLEYVKDNKKRKLLFGLNKVCKTKIPEDGYSYLIGNKPSNIHYKTLGSGAIINNKLTIFFEIIDIYLGCLAFEIDSNSITMYKDAENYLNEFSGTYKIKTGL